MRSRPIIHVGGPAGAGKTTLIESLLRAYDGPVLVARCSRDDSLRKSKDASPRRGHPELQRYRKAGAEGTAVFSFLGEDFDSDAFYMSDLMQEHSHAVVLEGDSPLGFPDLRVFVAPALTRGRRLLVRRKRDRAAAARAEADALERLLRQPDGMEQFVTGMLGERVTEFARRNPTMLDETRTNLLAGIERVRGARPPKPTVHWAIAEGYAGIEHAQVVVVNVREQRDVAEGERLLAGLRRVRKDPEVFDDILGRRGTRIPITAATANLAASADPGTRKVVARIKRLIRRVSE